MRIVSAQPAMWRWPTSSASWKVCSAAASAAVPVAETERGVGHQQPGRAHRGQGTRFLRAPAQFGVLGSRLLELPERDARPEQDVQPRPVRAELVQALREAERLGQHRPGLGRLAAQQQGPAAHRQHRRAHGGIACVAEQADGPLGQLFGLEVGVDGGRAVGGVGEHLRRQHRPPGRDTVGLADQQGRGLGGPAPPDLQPATELLGPGALLFVAGHLGRLGEQGERTIGQARGGCRLAGRDQAAARGFLDPARGAPLAPARPSPWRRPGAPPPGRRPAPGRPPPPRRAPIAAAARCHAWRSSSSRSTAARAACAARRAPARASEYTRPRISGCAKVTSPAASRTSPDASASASCPASVPACRHAAAITGSSVPAYAAATSRACRAGPDSASTRPANARCSRPPGSERELERGHAGPLAGGQRGGQLDQGQRVARRGLRDRRRDRRRQLRGALPQKLGRRGVVDRPDGQLRQADALGRVPRVPRGQHDRERPAGPPGDVLDALPGGRVDPLDVVHHGEDRPVPGLGPQHAERGDADRQAVTWRGRLQRQRAHQRGGLRRRQRVQLAQHRVREGRSARRRRAPPRSRRRRPAPP